MQTQVLLWRGAPRYRDADGPTRHQMRWFHRKVVGHPTQYELEVAAYDNTHGYNYLRSRVNLRALAKLEFTNEFLGEPVPMEITRTVIPRARSMGKSEDIAPFYIPAARKWAPGESVEQRSFRIDAPVITEEAVITNAATVYISGPPIAGTDATVTRRIEKDVTSGDA